MDIRGKAALITGGGTGLGHEISLQLAREGVDLAIGYSRSSAEAAETALACRELGVRAVTLQADLSNAEAASALPGTAYEALGRLDLLIHNAGTTRFVAFPDIDKISPDDWDEIFAVNTRSAFFMAQAAAPLMRQNGGGQIITTSSIAGIDPLGSSIPYACSKAALIHLTQCLSVALAPDIRVNSVAPGLLITRWVAGFSEERIEQMQSSALLGRAAHVADTAAAYVMLAKNESITGQTIVVDAGQTMR